MLQRNIHIYLAIPCLLLYQHNFVETTGEGSGKQAAAGGSQGKGEQYPPPAAAPGQQPLGCQALTGNVVGQHERIQIHDATTTAAGAGPSTGRFQFAQMVEAEQSAGVPHPHHQEGSQQHMISSSSTNFPFILPKIASVQQWHQQQQPYDPLSIPPQWHQPYFNEPYNPLTQPAAYSQHHSQPHSQQISQQLPRMLPRYYHGNYQLPQRSPLGMNPAISNRTIQSGMGLPPQFQPQQQQPFIYHSNAHPHPYSVQLQEHWIKQEEIADVEPNQLLPNEIASIFSQYPQLLQHSSAHDQGTALLEVKEENSAFNESSSSKDKRKIEEIGYYPQSSANTSAGETRKKFLHDGITSGRYSHSTQSFPALKPSSYLSVPSFVQQSTKMEIGFEKILRVHVRTDLGIEEFRVIVTKARGNDQIPLFMGIRTKTKKVAEFPLLIKWQIREGDVLTVTVNIELSLAEQILSSEMIKKRIRQKTFRFSETKLDIVFPYMKEGEIIFLDHTADQQHISSNVALQAQQIPATEQHQHHHESPDLIDVDDYLDLGHWDVKEDVKEEEEEI